MELNFFYFYNPVSAYRFEWTFIPTVRGKTCAAYNMSAKRSLSANLLSILQVCISELFLELPLVVRSAWVSIHR
jgi:hypothetical protein